MSTDSDSQKKNLVSRLKGVAKRLIKDATLGMIYPFVYSRAACKPIDERKAVFLESKQEALPDSFRLLYSWFENDKEYDAVFISLGQHRVSRVQYYRNCLHALKEAATARYVFLNDASDVISCVPLRKECKVIQLWHACGAFKKWGMSTAELKFGGSRKQIMRHPFYENLSLVTVSSPEVIWAYAEAMKLEGREEIIKPTGVSRTDVFFDSDFLALAQQRVSKTVPRTTEKKVLLYAPTFRGRVSKALAPDRLDIRAFQEALGSEYVLLIKHHPFVKSRPPIPAECSEFAFDVSDELPIEELLCVADVCISDYSSLVFEYSLFERPMLFFAYDKEEYDDWRGFYYSYEDLAPGPVFRRNDEMIDYLLHIEELFDKKRVESFKRRFMSACDGNATERILEEIL